MATKVDFLKVAAQGDDSEIDGISLWAGSWEQSGASAFMPQEFKGSLVNSVRPHKLTLDGQTIHFWAGELKTGGFAIYVSTWS